MQKNSYKCLYIYYTFFSVLIYCVNVYYFITELKSFKMNLKYVYTVVINKYFVEQKKKNRKIPQIVGKCKTCIQAESSSTRNNISYRNCAM